MSGIPASIRAELDVTPEWWDSQYRALERKRIPRDPAYHEAHNIIEEWRLTRAKPIRHCADCGVTIDPYEEGTE